MKNQVIHTQNARPSCIGYDNDRLMISSMELHSDFESLAFHTESFYKSGTNGYAAIPLDEIKEIKYHEKHEEFFIRYKPTNSDKLKKYYLSIKQDVDRETFCTALANECKLDAKLEFKSPYAGLFANLVFMAFTLILSYALYSIASGGSVYHRKASVHLVAEILKFVHPLVIIITGGSIASYFIFRIVINYINPTQTINYKKA